MQGEVKLNLNQVLREQTVLLRDEKSRIKKEKDLQVNLRDSSEFENWRKREAELELFGLQEKTYKRIRLLTSQNTDGDLEGGGHAGLPIAQGRQPPLSADHQAPEGTGQAIDAAQIECQSRPKEAPHPVGASGGDPGLS